MSDFAEFVAKLDGRKLTRHAVLTLNGTWGEGLVQYPGDVVNGLNEFVDFHLCEEVPIDYPASFGPVGGSLTGLSYEQSVQLGVQRTVDWINANPTRTFVLIGYSQGAEVVSRVAMMLMDGSLPGMDRFVGGITFGNPCRGGGFHAPGIADPGGHGISSTRMNTLPVVAGQVAWADYVHSPANGDAALDMYGSVPNGPVGQAMVDVYLIATALQFNDLGALTHAMIEDLTKAAYDSGLVGSFKGGIGGLLEMGFEFILGMIEDAISGPITDPTPGEADGEAAVAGLKFITAPGGPTAPHISYLAEIPGYSNMVAQAVGFLHQIALAVPARN